MRASRLSSVTQPPWPVSSRTFDCGRADRSTFRPHDRHDRGWNCLPHPPRQKFSVTTWFSQLVEGTATRSSSVVVVGPARCEL
ncbi:hypothetical protein GW17_00017115 [Ensete ventricosum]|nr:hypothetical protein GW17_00017115 [Ensete ventricosum]